MTDTIYKRRPSCSDILSSFDSWGISHTEIADMETEKLEDFPSKIFYNICSRETGRKKIKSIKSKIQ